MKSVPGCTREAASSGELPQWHKMAAEPQSAEEVVKGFNEIREQVNQIYQKINELEMQGTEHKLVLTTIEKMEKERKCYRLVGGVLVERTVGEVIPAVQRNKEGLGELVKKLAEQLELKKEEMDKYQVRCFVVELMCC